ncbi:hypothetical protein HOP50_14g73410 [Chloropicon primus]|uniref:RWP-RK domain-containing protein n=1 Tax=Chloropicon primus TaxID=1764295 RepID=A0A5B8MWW0_9CHLO|nr:hypothetical protein A3770_14p73190 [Chloropicon primus]UPR04010.1 hypothetical protein HOP50_14g73410 [Chloropicon primus]|eukprot:QDZ24801.1 hypothetical protein A3770_14p73190 [Chloropicon primus]
MHTTDVAAEKLNVSTKTLRRRCKDFGIKRWPPTSLEVERQAEVQIVQQECLASTASARVSTRATPNEEEAKVGGGGGGREVQKSAPFSYQEESEEDDDLAEEYCIKEVEEIPPNCTSDYPPTSSTDDGNNPPPPGMRVKNVIRCPRNILKIVREYEREVKENASRREVERRKEMADMKEWCSTLREEDLFKKFQNFRKKILLSQDDKLKKASNIIKVLCVSQELYARKFEGRDSEKEKDSGEKKTASSASSRTSQEEAYVQVLSFHLGRRRANLLMDMHKTLKQNMYNDATMMACWLAGLGCEKFDAKGKFSEGVEKLKNQIENADIHAMAVWGRMLKSHSLEALSHYFQKPEYDVKTPHGKRYKEVLAQLLSDEDEKAKAKEDRTSLELDIEWVRRWAESVIVYRVFKANCLILVTTMDYRRFEISELYKLFNEALEKHKKSPDGTALSALSDLEIRQQVKLVAEMKLRLMAVLGKFAGENLFWTGSGIYEHYVVILTMNLGPTRAKSLLRIAQVESFNWYESTDSMASLLIGLGYWRKSWTSLDVGIVKLSEEMKSGEFDAMANIGRLLEQNDLPWPPNLFLNKLVKKEVKEASTAKPISEEGENKEEETKEKERATVKPKSLFAKR